MSSTTTAAFTGSVTARYVSQPGGRLGWCRYGELGRPRLGGDRRFEQAVEVVTERGVDSGGMRSARVYQEGAGLSLQSSPARMLACLGTPARIEQYLPIMPRSRADVRLKNMVKSVGACRSAFAQPQQEDLLAHLQRQVTDEGLAGLAARGVTDLRQPANLRITACSI